MALRALRIAMIAACPFPCERGTPVRILRLAEALAERGHELHVVTYHLGDALDQSPLKVHRIRDFPSYDRREAGPTLQKLLLLDPVLTKLTERVVAEQEIDLIHAHHAEGLLAGRRAARRSDRPLVFDAHTLLGSELPFYAPPLTRRLSAAIGRWFDARLPGMADHVITVSHEVAHGFRQIAGAADDRVTVVPNGVEIDRFDAAAADQADAPDGAGVNGSSPVIIFTGNLAAYQGIDDLLHAFAIVHAHRPEARLRIVTQDRFDAHRRLASRLGIADAIDVVRGGFELVPGELVRADIAVNPRTIGEGLPQKLLNYMAAARPIVSFAGSARHLEHGETGWIVPDEGPRALADGILHLLEHPQLAAALGRAARVYVKAEMSWPCAAERCERVYETVLRRRGRG